MGADNVGKGVSHGRFVTYVEEVVDPADEVDGSNSGTLGGQALGGGGPDAGGPAGDHRNRPNQSFHCRCPLSFVTEW